MNDTIVTDDATLLTLIARGNKDAFAQLLKLHLQPLLVFIRRYMNDVSHAEDIAQETFTRIWQHAKRWKKQDVSPRSWFYRIAYNLCMDQLRRQPGRTEVMKQHRLEPSAEQVNMLSEQQQQLEIAMSALPERQRTALFLCGYQGLSNMEAATILEVSVDALESLLARGRRGLKKHFESYEGETDDKH